MESFYFKEIETKSGHHVRFRPEKREDLAGIWALYSSLSEESRKSVPPFDRQLIERWSENLSQYMFPPILAVDITNPNEERVIGRAVLAHSDRPSVRHRAEFGIVIHDDFQDLGIGTELTKFMLEISCRHGLMKIILEVFPDNRRAIHVYEKCGFAQEGSLTKHYFFHGRFHDVVVMSYNCRKK